jgi:hypothetical protein
MIWLSGSVDPGWACSRCQWRFPLPTLLEGEDAKKAYDRLAAAKFRDHSCETQPPSSGVKRESGPTFADRAKKLVKAGYKPKDAVELLTQEIVLEHRNDRDAIEKARADADDFLLKVRKGLI